MRASVVTPARISTFHHGPWGPVIVIEHGRTSLFHAPRATLAVFVTVWDEILRSIDPQSRIHAAETDRMPLQAPIES